MSVQKLYLWLIVLILILACAPAGVTPIPPLDPNAVQLYLQQTAAVAATQTQRAIPTVTATQTFTPTPRSTFTLEPTYTPFTFIVPSPKQPSQMVQYFRLKHDHQLAIYNYKSRTVGLDWGYLEQTPEIVPLSPAPKEGTGTHRTPMTGAWEIYINELNGNDKKKLTFLKSSRTALFNGAGFPQMESLTMGGNIITLEAIENGWGKVHTQDYSNPSSAGITNYFTDPSLVHKVVIVTWSTQTKTTIWVNPPQGDIYWPFVARNDVWVQMERLEPFPVLPMVVTARVTQPVYMEPKFDSEVSKQEFIEGSAAKVIQYLPSGSDVWGLLENGRWIVLFQYTKDGPTYFTTWSMETIPPIP